MGFDRGFAAYFVSMKMGGRIAAVGDESPTYQPGCDTRPVDLGLRYPTLRQEKGEGWGTHLLRWVEATKKSRSPFDSLAEGELAQGRLSAPLKSASLGMTRRGWGTWGIRLGSSANLC